MKHRLKQKTIKKEHFQNLVAIAVSDGLLSQEELDFLVEKVIAVELKARTSLEDAHYAQAFNYLKCYDLEVGLLINFGDKSLVFKRLQNKVHKQANQGNPLL